MDVSEGEGPSGGEGRKEGGDVVRRSVGRWVDERRGEVGRGCLSVVDSQMGCERRAIERGVKVGEAKGKGGRIEARDAVGERMVGRGRSRGGWMY